MTTQNFLHKGEVLAFFVSWLTFLVLIIGDHLRHTGMGFVITASLKRRLR